MEKIRLKDLQKKLIYECITHDGSLSRKQIANHLEIRPIDVTNYVNELIADGLVSETKKQTKKRGRPEMRLMPLYQRMSAVAITVVSRHIKGCIVDMAGLPLSETVRYLSEDISSEDIYRQIDGIIGELISDETVRDKICGIGFSLSGIVDSTLNTWIKTTRWPSVNNLSLSSLGEKYKLPLHVGRNITSKMRYLLLENSNLQKGGILLVHWGWAVKAAYAFNNTIIQSTNGDFGEIGHWKVDRESEKICSCGKKGCLETEAALWYLLKDIRKRFPAVPSDEEQFTDFFKVHSFEELAPFIIKARSAMAIALKNLYLTFFPENIYIYGPFTDRDEVFFPLLDEFTKELYDPLIAKRVTRLDAKFQGDNLGCTFSFFRDCLKTLLIAKT